LDSRGLLESVEVDGGLPAGGALAADDVRERWGEKRTKANAIALEYRTELLPPKTAHG
jgi:hypothetical protein